MLGGGLLLLVVIAGLAVAVAIILAPIKLYSIHTEIRYTNALLKYQSEQFSQIISELKGVKREGTSA